MQRNDRLIRAIRAFFALLLAFEIANWIGMLHVKLEFTWSGLILTLAAVWGVVEAIQRWLRRAYKTTLPWYAFALAFVPVAYDAIGDTFHLYGRFLWYDQYGHLQGGAATAAFVFIVFAILRNVGRVSWGLRSQSFFAFTTAVTFGVFYELEEYGEDLLACYHRDLVSAFLQRFLLCGYRFGDALDTGNDLFMNVVGGILVLAVVWVVYYLKREHTSSEK